MLNFKLNNKIEIDIPTSWWDVDLYFLSYLRDYDFISYKDLINYFSNGKELIILDDDANNIFGLFNFLNDEIDEFEIKDNKIFFIDDKKFWIKENSEEYLIGKWESWKYFIQHKKNLTDQFLLTFELLIEKDIDIDPKKVPVPIAKAIVNYFLSEVVRLSDKYILIYENEDDEQSDVYEQAGIKRLQSFGFYHTLKLMANRDILKMKEIEESVTVGSAYTFLLHEKVESDIIKRTNKLLSNKK